MVLRMHSRAMAGPLAALLACTSTTALAQSATESGRQATPRSDTDRPTQVETPSQDTAADGTVAGQASDIVVTGIRATLEAGIDIKRESNLFVDSVVAEDIGRLPDQNVAESLSRVSGVQVQRGIDEASDISIRGLRQNRTEFNGRTLISPYGRGDAGPDEGAYNVLTLIPSELVGRLDVTKLNAPSGIDGSLGGTVNILSRQAKPGGGMFLGGSLEVVHKDLADKPSWRGTALIADTILGGKLGYSLGVNYQVLNIRQDSFTSNAGWQPLDARFNNNPSGVTFDPNGDGVPGFYLGDLRYQVLAEQRRKLGITGGLQFRPSSSLELYTDVLYAKADTDRRRNWIAVQLVPTGSSYTSVTLSPNENLIAGTIRAAVQGNAEYFDLPTTIWSGALGGRWDATDRLQLRAEGSYTRGSQDYIQTFIRNQTAATVPIGFDFRGSDVPSITLPSTVSLTDPAQQVFTSTFDNKFVYLSKEVAGRFDVEYEIGGGLRSIAAGVRYNKITTTRDNFRGTTTLARLPVANYPGSSEVFRADDLLQSATGTFPKEFLVGLPFANGTQFACTTFVPSCTPQTYDPTTSYKLEEPVYAGYLQANIDADLWGIPVSGVYGVRYVRSEVRATGVLRANNTQSFPRVVEVGYTDILPSLALKFELDRDLLFRFGAAKTIARPASTDLSPALSVNETLGTATAGNPELEPFRISQLDASLEWYPRKGTIYAVSLFYKDLESFIVTRQVREAIPGFTPLPAASPDGLFRITRQINGAGGVIKGVEVLAQQPFTFLPAPLDGFGLNATYSFIDSSTPFTNVRDGKDLPLEGLSRHNVNLVGYYEKNWFGLRVGYNWRSRYLNRIGSGGDGVFYQDYQSLSASVRFNITKGVTLQLEGANLTNEPLIRYGGFPEALASYNLNGVSYTAGLRVRF